ncbi:MAG: M23 family metallopeptidase [Thermoleophilaceae bacterium]|nr:M23 family metallopeptidase [Thermoleophilaceae bacterium]
MFARCGTRLAAARGGRVEFAGYHSAAGNYVVIDGAGTGIDYVYMHMRETPLVQTGQRVFTGQRSARSARRAAPLAATSTSSCGRRRAGTRAARRSTRCRRSRAGTRTAEPHSVSTRPLERDLGPVGTPDR